jgi:hypothetical protein
MAKFINTTGLNQVVILQGKKTVVEDGGVLETDSSFTQFGFEPVDDSVPTTVVAGVIRKRKFVKDEIIAQFENKLQDVISDKEKLLQDANEKVRDLAKISEENSNNFKKEFEELKNLTLEMTKQVEIIQKDMSEFKKVTYRRLEIVKGAIQALELQLDSDDGKSTPGKPTPGK